MNFITLSFAFFFLFVLAMGTLFRKGTFSYKFCLLGFNLFFYAVAGVSFIPLLLLVGGMNWLSAKLTFNISFGRRRVRKSIIGINVAVHVLLLVFYKYYEFFLLSMEAGFSYFGINMPLFNLISTSDLLFPVGLSFYTFQGLSYSIDQYRNPKQKPESFFNVLLFVSFFPTILAGPILRGHDFFAQLHGTELRGTESRSTKRSQVSQKAIAENTTTSQTLAVQNTEINKDVAIGFSLILSGLFKKVVIASYLSEHIVRDVFLTPEFYSSTTILVAVYAYAMQIYCDFSGYSDIATGIARLMGYKIPQNFNAPYLACSVQDFWRRWHITLSLWLRDYLYIPLGGNKKGSKSLNLIITMTLGGLWHGSHLRFLIWGLMHGIGLCLVHLWQYFCSFFHKEKGFLSQNHNKLGKDCALQISQTEQTRKTIKVKRRKRKNKVTSEAKQSFLQENFARSESLHKSSFALFKSLLTGIKLLIGWFITFHFVSVLWIFFRAEDTQAAFDIIQRIIAFNLPGDGFPALVLVAIFTTMFLQFFGPYIFRFFVCFLQKLWAPMQILIIAIVCAIILKLGPDGVLPFIYFQF